MLADQHGFRRRLRALTAAGRDDRVDPGPSLDDLARDLAASAARRRRRARRLPRPTYPPDLPIAAQRETIATAMREHPVVIVCGETGSGKTTQLPKICLELGRGVAGLIGHTQPRRIAARAVAARIAHELGSPLGTHVGYRVRFTDRTSPEAFIKLMTDGILLAETQRDRHLSQYDTIILDEAHERSLNIDFLLGYLKQLLPKRPDLKLIITSATIDPKRFSDHFDGAPIIEVSGRAYPVEVRYRPVQAEEPDEEDPTLLEAIVGAVDEVLAGSARDGGDLLVFLSGEREIRETAAALERRALAEPVSILPLYAQLSADEQNRVFEPHERRRIVLATNVAETSLTVPGIRFVIDPGYARLSRYSASARVQRLPIEPVSQASADQRKGRCGRIGPGICIRLYSEDDFRARPAFTDPEILRANLASVILQMKALRLGDLDRFPFIDPPPAAMVREGHQTLVELGALTEQGALTPVGRELARLPIDPRLGRMILAAREERCLREVLVIASALATQDPRLRPLEAAHHADRAHRQFHHEHSDVLTFLNLWDLYHQQAAQCTTSQLRRFCQETYLSYLRMREWQDVHRQLAALARAAGMSENPEPASAESVHRAVLAGLLGNIGLRGEGHEYHGPHDRRFHLFPGSVLFRNGPMWVMAAEMVETSRLYARTVARVQPEWIERLAAHLVKRTHSAPFWNAASGHVEAFEKVSLYGLTIVPKRRVHFGAVDPKLAREVFIQHALVEGDYRPPRGEPPFLAHNRALLHEARTLEAKLRRRDIVAPVEDRAAFYDHLLPADINNGPRFEKWRRAAEGRNPRLLYMSRDDLLRPEWRDAGAAGFPDTLREAGRDLPLDYHLAPGEAEDGVTLTVPLDALHAVDAARLEWLVPGRLTEKITALIRGLPKALRVPFNPAPGFAARCAAILRFGHGALPEALSRAMRAMTGIDVPPQAWPLDSIPDDLRLNIAVVDDRGQRLAAGRRLDDIRRELGDRAAAARAAPLPWEGERTGLTDWSFDDLPARIELTREDSIITGYPALLDEGGSVALRLLRVESTARHAHRHGLRRLLSLRTEEAVAAHLDYHPLFQRMVTLFASLGPEDELRRHLIDRIAERAFMADDEPARTAAEFQAQLHRGMDRLWTVAAVVLSLAERILQAAHEADLQLASSDSPFWSRARADMTDQLGHLLARGFLAEAPWRWLTQYPRYLRGIGVRLQRLANAGLDRDQRGQDEIERHWSRYEAAVERSPGAANTRTGHTPAAAPAIRAAVAKAGPRYDHWRETDSDPALEHYRWMIEELRISLFAQELGTAIPVSPKRLDRHWATVRASP